MAAAAGGMTEGTAARAYCSSSSSTWSLEQHLELGPTAVPVLAQQQQQLSMATVTVAGDGSIISSSSLLWQ
jgi:hypothetical protein